MRDSALQVRAEQLAAQVGTLARELREAGVPDEAAAQLLADASVGVLQTLTLELLGRTPAPASDVRLAA